jgi:hypothetical protein
MNALEMIVAATETPSGVEQMLEMKARQRA